MPSRLPLSSLCHVVPPLSLSQLPDFLFNLPRFAHKCNHYPPHYFVGDFGYFCWLKILLACMLLIFLPKVIQMVPLHCIYQFITLSISHDATEHIKFWIEYCNSRDSTNVCVRCNIFQPFSRNDVFQLIIILSSVHIIPCVHSCR